MSIEIYTDGSHFKHGDGYLGIGAYCKYKDTEYKLSKDCGKLLLDYGINEKVSNPTAEFIGFCEILKLIYMYKVKCSFVFKIDYEGIENWMTGKWKCKKSYIKKIKEQCDFYIKNIPGEIKIKHVKGHSKNYGNNQADILAKSKTEMDTFTQLFQNI